MLFVFIAMSAAAAAGTPASSQTLGELAPSIEGRLSRWIEVWEKASPDFDLKNFRLLVTRVVPEAWGPYGFNRPFEEQRKKLYLISPDGVQAINPYVGLQFDMNDGRIRGSFDVDQTVTLIDLKGRRYKILATCGPSCGFHDAAWLTAAMAIVAGYSLDYDDPNCPNSEVCKSVPHISLYDFRKGVEWLFAGPGVPAGPRHAYAIQRIREKLPQVGFY